MKQNPLEIAAGLVEALRRSRAAGLTPNDAAVLLLLAGDPRPWPVSEIAERTGGLETSLQTNLANLRERGLIGRSTKPNNARGRRYHICVRKGAELALGLVDQTTSIPCTATAS